MPTFNEKDNIATLLARLSTVLHADRAEVIFVDDSTDTTPDVIRAAALSAAATGSLPVRLVHREPGQRTGGLAGAVTAGIREAAADHVVVMDGDLQHPPELVPVLRESAERGGFDVVVASRYCGGGDAQGLSNGWRRGVSSTSTLLVRGLFPRRVGSRCSDPMTGFFCVRRSAVDLSRLRPRGFKILLEILASHDLRVAEIPFVFGERHAGRSKASWRNGVDFLHQTFSLRASTAVRVAAVGVLGLVVNLALMTLLLATGQHYVLAALLATAAAIAHNTVMLERFVFGPDLLAHEVRLPRASRVRRSVLFNSMDAVLRLLPLVLLVSDLGMPPVLAQAVTLLLTYAGRFALSVALYRPVRTDRRPTAAHLVASDAGLAGVLLSDSRRRRAIGVR